LNAETCSRFEKERFRKFYVSIYWVGLVSGSRATCEKGYYSRRVAEVILRNATLEEIKNLSLEILIAEVSLKMRSCNMTDEEKKELQILLEDLENAKKLLYKAYLVESSRKKKRVVRWI